MFGFTSFIICKLRKLAMLAGVPLALARNMPGAGPAHSLILSDFTPPRAACNPEVVGSTPPPSIGSKTVVCKMHNLEVFRLLFHLGCLDSEGLIKFHRGRILHDGRVGFHLGGVFFRHVQATFPCLAPAKPPPC